MSGPSPARVSSSAAVRTRDDVGGDFELVSPHLLRADDAAPPWEADGVPIAYVQSGRQALALAAGVAWARGHRDLLAPAYLCDSMLQPFVAKGMTVSSVPVDERLHVQPDDLATVLASTHRPVVLHASYFGQSTPPALADGLRAASTAGALVVSDETHSLLGPGEAIGEIRIASLRKLLPLADGGYVAGIPVVVDSPQPLSPDFVTERLIAMREKSAYIAGAHEDPRRHLRRFHGSEAHLEERGRPALMSGPSRALLERLDYHGIARARRRNAATLMSALAAPVAAAVLNPPDEMTPVPSHLVLRAGSRHLQAALAAERIYCPIHWPPSRILTGGEPWPENFLSVPVDQRYGEADMLRVATAINRLTR